MTVDWQGQAADLADALVDQGKLSSPDWIAAVRETPRHLLVPRFFEQVPKTGEWREISTEADGRMRIYSNIGVYTKIGPDPVWGHTIGLSSTSTPGLSTRMLEDLDVHDGHHVLEIGTGTGYNAALLCHRLGDHLVVSVDIEPELVELARGRLAEIGHRPTLATVDGVDGYPEHAPYDRIIATCAVPEVPWAWISQLRNGGTALVDIKRSAAAGNLALLRRHGNRAEGRFDSRWANFMPLRTGAAQHVRPPERDRSSTAPRPSTIGYVRPWENTVAWYLAALTTPADVVFGHTINSDARNLGDIFLYAPDGSWCELSGKPDSAGQFHVWEGGPHALWNQVERARDLYQHNGEPRWERLGVTVTPTRQWIWLDDPHHAWPCEID